MSYMMVHNKLAMRFFYSLIMNILIFIYNLILTFVLSIRFRNLNNVCTIIDDYYLKYSESQIDYSNKKILETCKFQKMVYTIWIINEILILSTKLVSVFLAFRAHLIIRDQIKILLKAKNSKL